MEKLKKIHEERIEKMEEYISTLEDSEVKKNPKRKLWRSAKKEG